jgi:hypothetical protein
LVADFGAEERHLFGCLVAREDSPAPSPQQQADDAAPDTHDDQEDRRCNCPSAPAEDGDQNADDSQAETQSYEASEDPK